MVLAFTLEQKKLVFLSFMNVDPQKLLNNDRKNLTIITYA
jgi:hypothetical protein